MAARSSGNGMVSRFNNMNMMFIEFVKRETMPLPELRAAIRRQNKMVVGAIAAV
jgi:hypothetical protein